MKRNFNEYLRFGSFPYVAIIERNDAVVIPYLDGIYSTILIKDVASDMNGRTYYQVAASVLDESTLNRELEPLQKIADNYPKILLTLDDIGAGRNFAGIRHLNLLDWLQKI